MRAIVVGLGSMGRRRIRLLKKISPEYEIYGVDSKKERCKQAEKELGIETRTNLEDALEELKPDCAIISTAPLSHASIINICLKLGCHVFTEINLVSDGYGENIALAKEKNRTLFLSSTFLYRDEIQYIEKRVEQQDSRINYIYHIGQYLPDWHPWENFQDYFIGDKRTNGCREIMAIELPWITKVFGNVKSVSVLKSKNTDLKIDYADNYLVQIVHENGVKGMLAVDVVSRKAVRNLEIYGENLYLSWKGTPDSLEEYNIEQKKSKSINLYSEVEQRDGYATFVIENAYENELRAFIGEMNGENVSRHSFREDLAILELINSIEEM